MELDFEVKGLNRVKKQLDVAASFVKNDSDKIIADHAKKETKNMRDKPYVPVWPGQQYVRTGAFGRGFAYRRIAKNAHAVYNKERAYAAFVAKKGHQSGPIGSYPGHRGRWWTLEDTLVKTLPELQKKLGNKLEVTMEAQTDS